MTKGSPHLLGAMRKLFVIKPHNNAIYSVASILLHCHWHHGAWGKRTPSIHVIGWASLAIKQQQQQWQRHQRSRLTINLVHPLSLQ